MAEPQAEADDFIVRTIDSEIEYLKANQGEAAAAARLAELAPMRTAAAARWSSETRQWVKTITQLNEKLHWYESQLAELNAEHDALVFAFETRGGGPDGKARLADVKAAITARQDRAANLRIAHQQARRALETAHG